MITPVQSVADALIAFILSLLHDPAAAQEFHKDPRACLEANGLGGASGADVNSVVPIVVDDPTVTPQDPRSGGDPTPYSGDPTPQSGDPTPQSGDPAVQEITRILNQFTTIDNRATVVDQSTNQNIWMSGGDLTQVFDQSANVASGDHSMAAGHDIHQDQSTTAIQVGDVSIGNTTGSHNSTDDHSMSGTGTPPPADSADADAAAADTGHAATGAGAGADTAHDVAGAAGTALDATHVAVPESADPAPEPSGASDAPAAHDTTMAHTDPGMPDDHASDAGDPLTTPEPDTYHLDPDLDGDQ